MPNEDCLTDDKKDEIIELDYKNFSNVVNRNNLTLVDFWAPWCGPCETMFAIFSKLSKYYSDKVIFARVNIDNNPKIASEYEVFSIPSFILFKDGQPIKGLIGIVTESRLKEMVEKL
ncbi:MAG TPA: thioredoxin [Nitrososphaeraceae archaeon]|nr:thioredoxin [Nitrososphaeraceae archaeon]